MNDYDLINKLLEDGSEASLLKIKMIFDFEDYLGIYDELKNENLLKFLELFYDLFEEHYSENSLEIVLIKSENKFKVVEMFKNTFEKYVIEGLL